MIVGVAIKLPDGRTFSMPKPARHNDVIYLMYDTFKVRFHGSGGDSGFVDDQGHWLTRKEAEDHARACGQLTGKIIGSVLTSEDLW